MRWPNVACLWMLLWVHVCATTDFYTITWSDVPDSQPKALDTSNNEIGPCVCDLTFNKCDANCACDSDCSSTDKGTFSGEEPEGPVSQDVFECVDPEFVKVNARGGLTTELVGNALCITQKNTERVDYFKDQGTPTSAQFDERRQALDYSYEPDAVATSSAASRYTVDTPIAGVTGNSGGPYTLSNSGLFALPTAGLAGECSERNAPLYLRDVESGADARCTRYTTSLSTECTTIYSLDYYIDNRFAGSTPNAVPTTISAWESVNLTTLAVKNYNTGVETDYDLSVAPPAAAFTVGTGLCANALLRLKYVFSYSADGQITDVDAEAVIGDFYGTGTSFNTGQLTQEFTVEFQQSEMRPKSGNPGYRFGKQVLAGTIQSSGSKTAVEQLVDGLQVLFYDQDGVCDITSTSQYQVRFGEDMVVSCSLPRNRAGLSTLCTSTTVSSVQAIAVNRIGMWGNSDYTISSQWLTISKDPTTVGTFSSTTGVCTIKNVVQIEFLYAELGAYLNPQRKILSARVKYGSTDDWRFESSDATDTQDFRVYATVTWVHVEADELSHFVPSAPPIIPRLPRDVLYPLYIQSPASHTTPSQLLLIVFTIICLCFYH